MSMHFGDIAAQAAADGVISAEEILALRGAGWDDGKMEPEEAEALFVANDALTAPSAEWCDFFVEALSEFVVNTVEPHGYVDQDMADELIARIDLDGKVESLAELELLVRVLEKALNVPQSLKDYALRQIETAVLSSEGPTRHGELTADGINVAEAVLLRRMIFASGGDRPASVSQAEAELLFRLKDATLYDSNAPEWQTLFVQGVANYLLGFGGHEALSVERAGELERFMAKEGGGIGGFLGRVLTSKPDLAGFGSLLGLGGEEPDSGIEAWDDEAEAAAVLEPSEAHWLNDMLEADEELDELEKALIAFIDDETDGQFVPRR
jgi:hypothetical protein